MTATYGTEEDALLRTVLANPADDGARLVMADWYDDHGQPERAELIRRMVAGETEKDSLPVRRLLNAKRPGRGNNRWVWMGKMRALSMAISMRVRWDRGFVGHVKVFVPDVLGHAAVMFGEHPLTGVGLIDAYPRPAHNGGYFWEGVGRRHCTLGHHLPRELFDLMPVCWFVTAKEAEDAASYACVVYGRLAAGLPPEMGV
jgi:uncharacterized protein (TIGR02996 family)